MKRILDTVHGYIMVDELFIDHIIDTRLFQRLRRIEQTSTRSVYPSARHDRFIHSLGVFHIGNLMVDHLRKEAKENGCWGESEAMLEAVFGSFLSACLLHDIAHAPFSHTFEEYYGQKTQLANSLIETISNDCFKSDLENTRINDDPNFHEYASAIIAYKEYYDRLKKLGHDPELVARMITGVSYQKEKDTHQIHNCFISLLHGKIIDADRLDYACRDVWASGYSTSSVDMRRLVSALHIKRFENDYVVCFESNSLNEIEGVLNVKDFQVKYVLNHHVVNYEQYLLQRAAEHAALYYFPSKNDLENPGYEALHQIVNIDALLKETKTEIGDLKLSTVSDDDIVFLMKQDPDNIYYQEWKDRNYSCFALWKSKDDFYHYFQNVPQTISLKNNKFDDEVRKKLLELGYNNEDVVIRKATFKSRVNPKSLFLVVAADVVRYTDIKPGEADENKDVEFYYVFVKKKGKNREAIIKERKRLVGILKETIEKLYN